MKLMLEHLMWIIFVGSMWIHGAIRMLYPHLNYYKGHTKGEHERNNCLGQIRTESQTRGWENKATSIAQESISY
jgi:hypothetical protein